jgi:hypothetical protein
VKTIRRGVVTDREEIAADSAAGRFDQADHRVGGYCRVDGISAPLENLDAGARRERVACRNDSLARRHDGPSNDGPGSVRNGAGRHFPRRGQ